MFLSPEYKYIHVYCALWIYMYIRAGAKYFGTCT